jgi:hypothetical protein
MNVPLILIVILATLINISSYFFIAGNAPQFTVFTGAVHYPPDYQYYLSYITQGTDHWLRAYHLYTSESPTLEFSNWIYVLAGHITSFFHINAPVTYQLMVVAGSVVYLVTAYKLIGLCVKNNRHIQMISYILFLLSNALPNIHMEKGSWIFGYFFPFNNLGHPLLRLTNVPHHLAISCLIMASLYAVNVFWQQRKKLQLVFIGILGFLLSAMQPLHWALVGAVVGLTGLYLWRKTRTLSVMVPVIVFGIAGLIPALYLRHLYSLPPYSNMLAWEALQQIRIPFIHFLRLNGPVMILGIIGTLWVVKKMNVAAATLLLSSVISVGLFFSPLPERLNMLNIRFITVIPTLTASLITGQLLVMIAKKLDPKRVMLCTWFLVAITLGITFPVTWNQYMGRIDIAPPQDMNTYLPLGAYKIYQTAQRVIGPTDIVLSDYILSVSFAGMTGKHVYVAHAIGTIDFYRKLAEANAFIYTAQTPEEKIAWLKKNSIAYILTFAWQPITLPNLRLVDSNIYALLYKVL